MGCESAFVFGACIANQRGKRISAGGIDDGEILVFTLQQVAHPGIVLLANGRSQIALYLTVEIGPPAPIGDDAQTQPMFSQYFCHVERSPVSIAAHVVQKGTRSIRSEEHTSELQSRPHLVCRLLLEKKKKII